MQRERFKWYDTLWRCLYLTAFIILFYLLFSDPGFYRYEYVYSNMTRIDKMTGDVYRWQNSDWELWERSSSSSYERLREFKELMR
jgi:hypothetical protein